MIKNYFLFLSVFCTIFLHAQSKNVFDISRKGTLEEIKNVFKENPNIINSVDTNGYTPLILACYRGNKEVALFLAEKVSDVNYNNGMGSAVMAAVMSGNSAIVEKLIALKANLNEVDAQGKTALIYATFFNKNEIAKMLIKAGANLNIKDSDGKSAQDFANFNKNTELIILLN
ncbi:ankyrin repeat domain-containing protein [Flavobacterium sp. GNP001]